MLGCLVHLIFCCIYTEREARVQKKVEVEAGTKNLNPRRPQNPGIA